MCVFFIDSACTFHMTKAEATQRCVSVLHTAPPCLVRSNAPSVHPCRSANSRLQQHRSRGEDARLWITARSRALPNNARWVYRWLCWPWGSALRSEFRFDCVIDARTAAVWLFPVRRDCFATHFPPSQMTWYSEWTRAVALNCKTFVSKLPPDAKSFTSFIAATCISSHLYPQAGEIKPPFAAVKSPESDGELDGILIAAAFPCSAVASLHVQNTGLTDLFFSAA